MATSGIAGSAATAVADGSSSRALVWQVGPDSTLGAESVDPAPIEGAAAHVVASPAIDVGHEVVVAPAPQSSPSADKMRCPYCGGGVNAMGGEAYVCPRCMVWVTPQGQTAVSSAPRAALVSLGADSADPAPIEGASAHVGSFPAIDASVEVAVEPAPQSSPSPWYKLWIAPFMLYGALGGLPIPFLGFALLILSVVRAYRLGLKRGAAAVAVTIVTGFAVRIVLTLLYTVIFGG